MTTTTTTSATTRTPQEKPTPAALPVTKLSPLKDTLITDREGGQVAKLVVRSCDRKGTSQMDFALRLNRSRRWCAQGTAFPKVTFLGTLSSLRCGRNTRRWSTGASMTSPNVAECDSCVKMVRHELTRSRQSRVVRVSNTIGSRTLRSPLRSH